MADFWKGKKVLITGGSGLIGTPMMEKLQGEGAIPFNFDLETGCDILDYSQLQTRMHGNDVVIHLAALSHVEEARLAESWCWEINVQGTWMVLQACLSVGVKSVVTASSNHVYGEQPKKPWPDAPGGGTEEDSPLNQLDTYSATKIAADYCARSYAHNYNLPVAIVRNTNCYGPDDPHEDHIIPGSILSILKKEPVVIRSLGLTNKGYLYVDDVVDAYLLVAEKMYLEEILPGEVFNVSDKNYDAITITKVLGEIMGGAVINILGEPNDQHDENLDSSKIRALGWDPKYTLVEGLKKTIEGFRERMLV